MGRRSSVRQQELVGEASSGALSTLDAIAVAEKRSFVQQPVSDLVPLTLTTQIGLQWPQDGRTHYYGPGKVELPFEICERLRRLPHCVVAR